MPISSRQFNQDSSGAKTAARDRPVFIIESGKMNLLDTNTVSELRKSKSGRAEPSVVA